MMPGENGFDFAAPICAEMRASSPGADPDADRAQRRRRIASRALRAASTIISASPSSRANWRCASPRSCAARSRAPRRGAGRRRCASASSASISTRGELRQRRRNHPPHRPRARNAAAARRERRRDGFARGLGGPAAPATSARSMCRSTGCAARSSAIRPIRCICRRRAGPAIACLVDR